MPRFDHTGPEGNGSRTGRGMGRCGGKAANAAGRGMGAMPDAGQTADQGMDASQNMGQGQNMGMGQGRRCRHGQRHDNRGGNCAANSQEACQGTGRGQGRGPGRARIRGMQQGNGSAGQAESCGAGPAAGSDAAGNNG